MGEPASIKDLLVAELTAIKQRVEQAAGDAEKTLLDTQYGQRLEHLAERIKALPDPGERPPEKK